MLHHGNICELGLISLSSCEILNAFFRRVLFLEHATSKCYDEVPEKKRKVPRIRGERQCAGGMQSSSSIFYVASSSRHRDTSLILVCERGHEIVEVSILRSFSDGGYPRDGI